MKEKIKTYLTLGILLIGISLFLTNCEKDDGFSNQTKSKLNTKKNHFNLKTKSYTELSSDSKFTEALDKTFKTRNTNSNSNERTIMEDQYGFTIDSTIIKEIYSNNYTSYTFLIHREENDESYFENLVVEIDSTNNIHAVIVKYTLNSNIIPSLEHDSFILDAEIEVTSIIYNNTPSKLSSMCIGVLMCPWGNEGDHPAGQSCIDADRGDLYLDTSMCPDSSGGEPNNNCDTCGTGTNHSNDSINTITSPVGDNIFQTSNNPCQDLNRITNSPYTTSSFYTLKTTLDLNGETGFAILMDKDFPFIKTFEIDSDESDEVPVPIHPLLYAFSHNHYIGKYEMFGPGDIHTLYKISQRFDFDFANSFEDDGIVYDNSNITVFMTVQNFTYAIKIDDITKLEEIQNIYDNDEDKNDFIDALEKAYADVNTDPELAHQNNLAKAFIKFTTEINDFGISLYKASNDDIQANNSNWQKLVLDTNDNVTPINCN